MEPAAGLVALADVDPEDPAAVDLVALVAAVVVPVAVPADGLAGVPVAVTRPMTCTRM